MASSDIDLQTDLRKRARRRLLGAIALALTAAIVLPIVMDHEPRPPAQDIAVRIPSRDNAPPLAPPARVDAPETEMAIPPAPPDSEPSAPGRAEGAAQSVPVVPPMPIVPAKPDLPKPEAVASTAATVEAPRADLPKMAVPSTDAARAAALLDGKASSFALQLGVFSDAANVARLRARAKELGFASFTEDVKLADGQTRTRVKVGPFENRAAAEAAQKKLEGAGLRSMVAPRS